MKKIREEKRKVRTRIKTQGTDERPRLSVFRSNKYVYAQIIDDRKQKTLIGVSEKELTGKEKVNKSDRAKELGKLIAKKALVKKITQVIFDRGGYKYHGRVKEVAQGAREGGLKF